MGWFSKKQQNVDWDINDIIDTKSKLQKFDEQWNTDTESQDLLTLPPHLSGSEIREQTEKFLQKIAFPIQRATIYALASVLVGDFILSSVKYIMF